MIIKKTLNIHKNKRAMNLKVNLVRYTCLVSL